MGVVADRRERLLQEQTFIEKERNMTIGKVQARKGTLPSPAEMAKLVAEHPPPKALGEVAVDERTVDELVIALAHVTDRSKKVEESIEAENQKAAQWRLENIRRRHNY